jgi:hypothetical protein
MGRPPKKRLREDDTLHLASSHELANFHSGLAEFSTPVFLSNSHMLPNGEMPQSTWHDVSTLSATPPIVPLESSPGSDMLTGLTPGTMSAGTPRCPCLSYLYLCLSNISTLNTFSVSLHTINTLCGVARTARSVIACEACPLQFASGMQNVMMLGTLLNVLADAWLRVWLQGDAVELGTHSAPPSYVVSITSQVPQQMETSWKQWFRRVICHYVIGGPADEDMGSILQTQPTPDVLSLIHEMEGRQRRWHAEGISRALPGSMPHHSTPSHTEVLEQCQPFHREEKDDHLCLKIALGARTVLTQFGFEPNEYSNSTES